MKKLFLLLFLSLFSFSNDGSKLVQVKLKNFKSDNSHHQVALQFINEPHWHTYWKNPGDSGLAIEFEYTVDEKKFKHEELEWPAPKLFKEDADIWANGYEGEQFFFHKLKISELKNAKKLLLKIKWLVCKDVCIPGKKQFEATIEQGQINWSEALLKTDNETLEAYIDTLPKEIVLSDKDFSIKLTDINKEDTLDLFFKSTKFKRRKKGTIFLTPFPSDLVSFNHEKISPNKANWLEGHIRLDWIGKYAEPEVNFPKVGKLKQPLKFKFLLNDGKKSHIVTREINEIFSLDQKNSASKSKKKNEIINSPSNNSTQYSFFAILFMAFLGGLILNLMPCVLPVISMKLFGLIKAKDGSRSDLIKHNLLYSLGVISTLMLLAFAIIFLKQSGEKIGWGFQLQSPTFVATLCLILFIMTLNFFGLFEFFTPGGRKLGNVKIEDSAWGDFLAGVLTTILSTPCSAPFLGSALAFALTSSTSIILIVFFAIGLGISAPFLLTCIFPQILNILPKPGMWMEKFKYFLGLTLLLTLIWLMDLLHSLSDTHHLMATIYPLFAFVFFFFFARKKINKGIFLSSLIVLISLFFGYKFYNDYQPAQLETIKGSWIKWSPELSSKLQSENKKAFIDFTAKWCLTCQVNKKLVLNTEEFKEFSQQNNIQLLKADWTKKDPIITDFLEQNNLAGIPAYFFINNGKLHFLGETVSIQKIKDLL